MEGRHYPPPPRRPYLRFPPPPPFPPADYAYAYYEPGAPVAPPNTGKHTFITRYGTEENIYEEIGASQLEEEVRYVHSRHLQVLDELNLTVEAMLMPEGSGGEGGGELGGGPDELLSPATCSLDSGFSGSSTGTNSLGRNPPSTPKTKKAPPFWKKLPGLHPTTPAPSPAPSKTQSLDEARCVSHGSSWDESSHDQSQRSSGSEPDLSSGDESSKSVDARQNGKGRSRWRRNSPSPDPPPPPGRLSRWFSIRRGSQYDLEAKERGKMPLLPEVEEEGGLSHRRLLPPSLPPPPPHLSPQELKRRHIVAAIVHSENSYLATLHRLVNDYKKPLEEASPAILSATKIQTLFHRLPEILQCHTLFRIALAEAVANWDRDHRIGDVFVASFSKAIVLDIYSGFINNFSVAMELARSETKRKPALAEFFKARQVSSHDRLSFFGLMVKPVQRFPQFILFLQDLLHHTGHGHPDRMSLQLALTQLESLAELLNERKREAEQSQAFRDMLRAISGKLSAKNIGDNHCLLRQDDVTQMELNQCGLISQYKSRRLLLLNDLLVCVSVGSKQDANTSSPQRLNLKWTCPISEVQVVENNTSPTLSRLLTPNNGVASSNGVTENLCSEMSRLMQDYQTVSRIAELAGKLHGSYPELSPDVTRGLLNYIQCEIQHKDDQMAWVDSCCLQLSLRNKDETFTFQMDSPEARKEWITELRLARLALDPANSPSWEVPDQEVRPCTKMPLFVAAHPVYTSQQQSEVVCGCYYTAACGKSYLWVCTTDGSSSHISIAQTSQTLLKPITQFTLPDVKVTAMEYVRGVEAVWIGTQCQQLLVYSVTDVDHPEQTHSVMLSGDVVVVKQHCDSVFVALSTGRLLVFRRHQLSAEPEEIVLGSEPVSCLLPINLSMYAACGKTVTVLRAITGEIQKNFTIQHEHVGGNVNLMATSGVGLWLSLQHSSTICLYHTETFKHLQDINVASNVVRLTGAAGPVAVTALLACKGLLWVGTDAGVSLTVPLPRLEGVPIISGRVSVSYHAHVGPTRLLLPLQDPPTVVKRPPSKALACDIYGLYGQLMYVKDYDGDDERLDMSHWSLSTSSEESGAPRHAVPDRRDHTLVTVTGGRGYVNLQQPCCTTITNNAHILLWEMKL